MQESGAGLHGGVKEVMAAARGGRLSGIQGTVAELIVVPKQVETAIEVALGGRLQDVVVARWADAETAIAHLKQSGAGRATFQPLDTVRGGRSGAPPTEVTRLPGSLGVAAELIEAPREMIETVVATMLGRTIVVLDLDTTRAALKHLPAGWNVVTLSGEIARAGGSVTGGSATRESGTLSRERELRDLPGVVAGLESQRIAARDALARAEAATRDIQEEQRQAEGERAALQAAAGERRQHLARLQGWLDELRAEQARAEQRRQELGEDQQQAASARDELGQQISVLTETREQAARAREEAELALAEIVSAASASERAAAEEGRRLAGSGGAVAWRTAPRGQSPLAGARAGRRARAPRPSARPDLDRERDSLAADHQRLTLEAEETARELAAAREARAPLLAELKAAERDATRLADAVQAARANMAAHDRERDHAGFALERATQDWELLRARIVEDLDVNDPDDVLAIESEHAAMPPAEREKAIGLLRERLRRTGYAGEDAVADYERERAHQDFLREQLADVEGAAAALRELLADLRQTMRARFDETYRKRGGSLRRRVRHPLWRRHGAARADHRRRHAEPGIEIIAQPPGKRLQGLALLSGGERALTAAALLFAILKVNPVPFCLLDEVDAALDEANVVRFREQLQELARQTQIIVVTHNRATIEIADTLYGVSMGADGVSQVLSLRMTESLSAD